MILGTHPQSPAPPPHLSLMVGAGEPQTYMRMPQMLRLLLPKRQGHGQQKRFCGRPLRTSQGLLSPVF